MGLCVPFLRTCTVRAMAPACHGLQFLRTSTVRTMAHACHCLQFLYTCTARTMADACHGLQCLRTCAVRTMADACHCLQFLRTCTVRTKAYACHGLQFLRACTVRTMADAYHCLQFLRTCTVRTMAHACHCPQFLRTCTVHTMAHSCDFLQWCELKTRRTARSESVTLIFCYDGVTAKGHRMSPLYFILNGFSLLVSLPGENALSSSHSSLSFGGKVTFRVAVTTCSSTQWIAEWGGNGIWHFLFFSRDSKTSRIASCVIRIPPQISYVSLDRRQKSKCEIFYSHGGSSEDCHLEYDAVYSGTYNRLWGAYCLL